MTYILTIASGYGGRAKQRELEMTERKLVGNAIRAIRAHKRIAKHAVLVALSYSEPTLRAYHWRRAVRNARIARIEFEALY